MTSHHRLADLFIVLLVMLTLVAVLLMTTIGAKMATRFINTLQVGVDIEGVEGNFIQGIRIDKIQWADEYTKILLSDTKLTFSLIPYNTDHFSIREVRASNLDIVLLKRRSQKPKTSYNVVIPNIPLPVDFNAKKTYLDQLRVINKHGKVVYSMIEMQVDEAVVRKSVIKAQRASAKPIIASYPLGIWLEKVEVNMLRPHTSSGHGRAKYAHPLIGRFDITGEVFGTWENYQANLNVVWKERRLGQSQASLKVKGDYDHTAITELSLDNEKGKIQGDINLNWFRRLSWSTLLSGKELDLSVVKNWPKSSLDTQLQAAGSYDYADNQWAMENEFLEIIGKIDRYPIKTSGKVTLKDSVLSLRKAEFVSGINRLRIDGKVTEPFDLDWELDARDISQIRDDMEGLLIGKGKLNGTSYDAHFIGDLTARRIHAMGVELSKGSLRFDNQVEKGAVAGSVEGGLEEFKYKHVSTQQVIFKINQLNMHSNLYGGKGQIQASNVVVPNLSMPQAQVQFEVEKNKGSVKIESNNSELFGKKLKQLSLSLFGDLQQHQASIKAETTTERMTGQFKGGWLEPIWSGRVEKASLMSKKLGEFRLKNPVSFNANKETVKIDRGCFLYEQKGEWCTNFQWENQRGMSSNGSLKQMPLAILQAWIDGGINLEGVSNGKYDFEYLPHQKISGTVSLTLPGSHIDFSSVQGPNRRLNYQHGDIDLTFSGNQIRQHSELVLNSDAQLSSSGKVQLNWRNLHATRMDQEVHFSANKVSELQSYLPDLSGLKGALKGTLRLKGLWNKPNVSGEMALKEGELSSPAWGVDIKKIMLGMRSQNSNQANIKGSMLINGKPLEVKGIMQLDPGNWRASLTAEGENLRVINRHEATVYMSPSLSVDIKPDTLKIAGDIHIPRMAIRLEELPQTAAYESEDVVMVGQEEKKQKSLMKVLPNVRVTLGDKITFNGFGLSSDLIGNLAINENKGAVLANGNLTIQKGVYRAYGQSMEIKEGKLVFNGPLNNPGLDIRATREVGDLTVGLNLAGTLQNPISSIFSDPPQADDEALSYLLTGQSLADASSDDTQMLVQAVRTLGINSGSSFLNKIGSTVGLDDVSIVSFGDYRQNRLQLGKRLTDNLYVRYITGLFDSFHTIGVDYAFSPRWSLEAESGDEQGIDFIYEIERD